MVSSIAKCEDCHPVVWLMDSLSSASHKLLLGLMLKTVFCQRFGQYLESEPVFSNLRPLNWEVTSSIMVHMASSLPFYPTVYKPGKRKLALVIWTVEWALLLKVVQKKGKTKVCIMGQGVGLHQAVLRTYSSLCNQGLPLVVLRWPYEEPVMELKSTMCKVSTCYTIFLTPSQCILRWSHRREVRIQKNVEHRKM